jgi:hypothetical protein
MEPRSYNGGRPPSRDWQAEQPEIERLLKLGYGCYRLGKQYRLTPRGMRLVLRRLGLRTLYQPEAVVTEEQQPNNNSSSYITNTPLFPPKEGEGNKDLNTDAPPRGGNIRTTSLMERAAPPEEGVSGADDAMTPERLRDIEERVRRWRAERAAVEQQRCADESEMPLERV